MVVGLTKALRHGNVAGSSFVDGGGVAVLRGGERAMSEDGGMGAQQRLSLHQSTLSRGQGWPLGMRDQEVSLCSRSSPAEQVLPRVRSQVRDLEAATLAGAPQRLGHFVRSERRLPRLWSAQGLLAVHDVPRGRAGLQLRGTAVRVQREPIRVLPHHEDADAPSPLPFTSSSPRRHVALKLDAVVGCSIAADTCGVRVDTVSAVRRRLPLPVPDERARDVGARVVESYPRFYGSRREHGEVGVGADSVPR